jgi:hypothetical protein
LDTKTVSKYSCEKFIIFDSDTTLKAPTSTNTVGMKAKERDKNNYQTLFHLPLGKWQTQQLIR